MKSFSEMYLHKERGRKKDSSRFFYVLLSLNVLSSSAWWVITIVTTQMEGSVTIALSTAARWISDDTLLNAYFPVTNGNIIKIYTWKTHLVLFLPSINIVWLFIFVFLLTFTLCSVSHSKLLLTQSLSDNGCRYCTDGFALSLFLYPSHQSFCPG